MSSDGSTVLLLDSSDGGPTLAQGVEAVTALGCSLIAIMHTYAHETTLALREVRERWSGPLGAYPNSGRFQMPTWVFEDVTSPQDLLEEARQWVNMGVQIIGVCCGMRPEHIRVLKEELPSRVP